MVGEHFMIHASGDPTVPFLDGYFIYCLAQKEAEDGMYMTTQL